MEFVWVVGLSAVGKQTFVRRVLSGPDAVGLRRDLGLSLVDGAVIARGSGFGVPDAQFTVAGLVTDPEVGRASHVLIKYQNCYDEERGSLDVLATLAQHPRARLAEHRIIAIWADPEMHVDWYMGKHGDRPEMSEDGVVQAMREEPPNRAKAEAHLAGCWRDLWHRAQAVQARFGAEGRVILVEALDAGRDYLPIRVGPGEQVEG